MSPEAAARGCGVEKAWVRAITTMNAATAATTMERRWDCMVGWVGEAADGTILVFLLSWPPCPMRFGAARGLRFLGCG